MTEKTREKYERLLDILKDGEDIIISFSGGVDSTFLLAAAAEALGDRVLAVTAAAVSVSSRDVEEARAFCRERGIDHQIVYFDELAIPEFRENIRERCYYCKKSLLSKVREVAAERGISRIAEGSNMDDMGDFRPGARAVKEEGIMSPLQEAGLYKSEIREISRELGLMTWDKPSFACLASRFPYGTEITEEGLRRIEKAEDFFMAGGYRQIRVRYHGDTARIEVVPEDIQRIVDEREEIVSFMRGLGFTYVALDLAGYRTGSMNETGTEKDVEK